MLMLAYGCGLRLSEVLAVRVADIDSERQLLRVRQGEGARIGWCRCRRPCCTQLRAYWRQYRPADWLFAGRSGAPLSTTSLQKAYTGAKQQAGVTKVGGIHALRHAYATHQLAAGLKVERLQRLMGHTSIHTTLRYVHWLPSDGEGELDLIAQLASTRETDGAPPHA